MLTRLAGATIAVLLALSLAPVVDANPADASGRPPVHEGDFPDPEIIRVGTSYYAYSTNVLGFWQGYVDMPVLHSTDMENWTLVADGLRHSLAGSPTWASWVDYSNGGLIWAPGVDKFGSKYVAFYTARHAASGKQCVGRGVSSSPTGPFIDNTSAPLKCQTTAGGTIDADTHWDKFGNPWLLFKNDGNCCGLSVHLWAQRLTADGKSLLGSPRTLLTYDRAWEYPLIEQPALVDGAGGQFLFYSGNWWQSSSYAIGYATCTDVANCVKRTTSGPWMGSTTHASGPGAADFFEDVFSQTWFAHHGWRGGGYPFGHRALFIEKPVLSSSTPSVNSAHPYPIWFSDVPPNHPFFQDIAWMFVTGISTGYADRTYRPLNTISRQAMAAFLYRLAGSPPGPFPDPGFSDIPPGHSFYSEIAWLKASGLATGFGDGTFRAFGAVSRQAMAAFLYRLAGSPPGPFPDPGFSDIPANHPFHREVSWLATTGITTGYSDGTFRPAAGVTRQAMAAFIHRYALL